MKEIGYKQMVSVGCGMDIHQDLIVATISKKDSYEIETREFEINTSAFTSLREWCKQEGVTHIAMESTGISWKPVYMLLQEDFEMILISTRHTKNVPDGMDKKDRHWLSKLLLSSLLKGNQVPARDIRELRDLVHYYVISVGFKA